MKRIRIISGGYGYKYNGRCILKDSSSEPFEVDDKEAERLVNELHIAVYEEATETDILPFFERYTVKELTELCSQLDISIKSKKRQDLLDALYEYYGDGEDAEENNLLNIEPSDPE